MKTQHDPHCPLEGRTTPGPERKHLRLFRAACCVVTTLLIALSARAQEYRGTIQGNVTDAKGYVIGGAAVEAKSSEQDYKIVTDAKGYFVIPFVQPGTYTVTVQAQGFRTEVQTGLILDVAQKLNLPLSLTAGGVAETVTVTTDTIHLATTDASGGTVLDPEKVQNLPLNGRQVYSLLALIVLGTSPSAGYTASLSGVGARSQAMRMVRSERRSTIGNWIGSLPTPEVRHRTSRTMTSTPAGALITLPRRSGPIRAI